MQMSLEKWRSDLHQIPELAMKEFKTTAYLMKELKKMGYEPKKCLETGCYVYVDEKKEKTLAFRADISGSAVLENSDFPLPSKHEGIMHADGHDGQAACLLGLAKYIKDKKDLPYNVLLIFQPSEEQSGTAMGVVQSGLLKKYQTVAIFAFHLMPTLEAGKIGLKEGVLTAQCQELAIKITGPYVELPQKGIDTIMIASQLMNMYRSILAKNVLGQPNALIHIGKIEGGTSGSSVAEKTVLHGTIRAYDENIFQYMTAMIRKMNDAVADIYHCQIETTYYGMYPPVKNDAPLCSQLSEILKTEHLTKPLMLAEDFAFYQKEVPGVFMLLGTKTGMHQALLHTPKFNFDTDILQKGVGACVQILENIRL